MTYDKSNIFAKILRGEIPCNKVYEDDYALAFHDISPAAPVHILVIPKGEFVSFHDFTANADGTLQLGFLKAIQQVIEQLNIKDDGYRLITNSGVNGSQSVPHFHMHILAGEQLGELLP